MPSARSSRNTITTSSAWCATSALRARISSPPSRTPPTSRTFGISHTRRFAGCAAEVILDCIGEATETKEKFRGLPLGARAVQIADGNTSDYFLTTFGRATRDTACSCEVKMDPNLSQALALLNGNTVHNKVDNSPVINAMLAAKKSPYEIVEELYLRTLSRKPFPAEIVSLQAQFAQEQDQRKAVIDLFWALLNSQEFIFNH